MATKKTAKKSAAKNKSADKNKPAWTPEGKTLSLAERLKARQTFIAKNRGEVSSPPLIRPASSVPSTYFLRRPTGITQLDIDLGGGWPAGGVSCLTGIDNAGKSTLLYLTCAMHQRIYGDNSFIAIAQVEDNPDFDWMRKVGFIVAYPESVIAQREADRKRRGLPPFTKEELADFRRQIGQVDIILAPTGEEIMAGVLDAVALRTYGIVAVDSVSALQSASEAAISDFDKFPQQSADAMLLTRFFKKLKPHYNGYYGINNTSLLVTQQMRSNRAKASMMPHMAKFAPDVVATGANALKHGKLIDCLLSKGQKQRERGNEDEKGQVLGRTNHYRLIKGKAGTHDELHGEYTTTYEKLFEVERTVLAQGMRFGAITETASLITVHKNGSDDTLAARVPFEEFLDRLRNDVEFDLLVRREVMSFAKRECIYREW